MNQIRFFAPVIFFLVGAYLLMVGLSADDTAQLLGGRVTMPAKFGILLGGIGILASIAIAFEMLKDKRPPVRSASR